MTVNNFHLEYVETLDDLKKVVGKTIEGVSVHGNTWTLYFTDGSDLDIVSTSDLGLVGKLSHIKPTSDPSMEQPQTEVQPETNQQTSGVPRRIAHIQVAGNPTLDQLQQVAQSFASRTAEDANVVTSNLVTSQVEYLDLSGIVVRGCITVDDIAQVARAVNTAYMSLSDEDKKPWNEVSEQTKNSLYFGIQQQLRYGYTAQQQHEAWCESKRAEGWVYGAVKDVEAKTHPLLVDFSDLTEEHRTKDALFIAVVQSMKGYLPKPQTTNLIPIQVWNGGPVAEDSSWQDIPFANLMSGVVFRQQTNKDQYLLARTDAYVNYLAGPVPQYAIDTALVTPGPLVDNVQQWTPVSLDAAQPTAEQTAPEQAAAEQPAAEQPVVEQTADDVPPYIRQCAIEAGEDPVTYYEAFKQFQAFKQAKPAVQSTANDGSNPDANYVNQQ